MLLKSPQITGNRIKCYNHREKWKIRIILYIPEVFSVQYDVPALKKILDDDYIKMLVNDF